MKKLILATAMAAMTSGAMAQPKCRFEMKGDWYIPFVDVGSFSTSCVLQIGRDGLVEGLGNCSGSTIYPEGAEYRMTQSEDCNYYSLYLEVYNSFTGVVGYSLSGVRTDGHIALGRSAVEGIVDPKTILLNVGR